MYRAVFFISAFILHLFFTACSVISSSSVKNESCSLQNLHFDQENNFCATIRVATIIANDLIVGFNNGIIGKWDINTGKVVNTFENNENFPILSIKQIHDILFIGTGSGALKLYNLEGKLLKDIHYGKGSLFAIDTQEKTVYIGFGSGLIGRSLLENVETIEIGEAHMYAVYDLKTDLDNKGSFYSASDDNTIAYWHDDGRGLELVRTTEEGEASCRKIVLTKNGVLVGTGNGSIIGYDKELQSQLFSFNVGSSPIASMVYKEGKLIVADVNREITFLEYKNDQWDVVCKKRHSDDVRNLLLYKEELIIISKNGMIKKVPLDSCDNTIEK